MPTFLTKESQLKKSVKLNRFEALLVSYVLQEHVRDNFCLDSQEITTLNDVLDKLERMLVGKKAYNKVLVSLEKEMLPLEEELTEICMPSFLRLSDVGCLGSETKLTLNLRIDAKSNMSILAFEHDKTTDLFYDDIIEVRFDSELNELLVWNHKDFPTFHSFVVTHDSDIKMLSMIATGMDNAGVIFKKE